MHQWLGKFLTCESSKPGERRLGGVVVSRAINGRLGALSLFLCLGSGLFFSTASCHGQAEPPHFVAFYDHAAGLFSSSNTVDYGLSGAGFLKDAMTGKRLAVKVSVTHSGATLDGLQGVPDYGTPASVVFDGFVDFGGKPDPGIDLWTDTDVLTYTFSGLDPGAEYNFQGTAVGGDIALDQSWSLFRLVGARGLARREVPGAFTRLQLSWLATNAVVIPTGNNVQGALAWWEHIRPDTNGTFSVESRLYKGALPQGWISGDIAYAITGFRLENSGTYAGRTNLPPRTPNPAPNRVNGVETVFLIVLENHDWSSMLDPAVCPFLNQVLLPAASHCNQYYSPRALHPSEPNYLWLVAGTNFGIRNDYPPADNHQRTTHTLFHQLDAAGISWRTYQEGISGLNIPDRDSGEYAARHNPFVFFDSVRTNLVYCTNHIRPFSELARDLVSDTTARFNFLTPNLTNDMHTLTPGSLSTRRQGDGWLSRVVPSILASPAYLRGGAVFITFDEGSDNYDGPLGMLVLSPRAKGGGYGNDRYYTHSSALRTFQNIFGVRPYLGDAAYADDLSDLFNTPRIAGFDYRPEGFALSVTNVIAGKNYYLEGSQDVATAQWLSLQTNTATASSHSFTHIADGGSPAGFYRVIEAP